MYILGLGRGVKFFETILACLTGLSYRIIKVIKLWNLKINVGQGH